MVAGDHLLAEDGTDQVSQTTSEHYEHELFDVGSFFDYDVALLHLPQPLTFTDNIQPACAPTRGQQYDWQPCIVSGWGDTTSPEGKLSGFSQRFIDWDLTIKPFRIYD